MTERLREHPDDLEALVGVTAEALGIQAVYVEKDFWVTEVLRAASVNRTVSLLDGSTGPVTFTFKGGTSLSRVFGIVERFSEDVDLLAVFPAEATSGARHRVLKEVDQAIRGHLALATQQVVVGSSTTGIKRYTTYLYPTGNRDPSLKEGVLLELALLKHGRHFYDIHCLLQDDQVTDALEALGSEGIRALVDDIDSQSAAAGFSSTPRPFEGYAVSAAFDRGHPARGAIEAGYEAAQALIYGGLVPLDVAIDTVHRRGDLL